MARYFANTAGDWLDLGGVDFTPMNGLPQGTLSGWFNPTSGGKEIILGRYGNGNGLYYLQYLSGTWYPSIRTFGSGVSWQKAATITEWTHVTMTFDGTDPVSSNRVKLYFNGVSQSFSVTGSGPTTLHSLSADFQIGSLFLAGRNDGQMAEIKFWNTYLTADEVYRDFIAMPSFEPSIEELCDVIPRYENVVFYIRCDGNNPEKNLANHKWNGLVNGTPSIVRHPFEIEVRDEEIGGFAPVPVSAYPAWKRNKMNISLMTR